MFCPTPLPSLVDISECYHSIATMTSFRPPYSSMTDDAPLLLHLKLLVLLLQVVLNVQSQKGAKQTCPAHDTSAGVVPGFLAVGEHVRCVKVRDSRPHEVDDGQGCGSLRARPGQRCAHPAHAEVVWRIRASGHQEHGEVAGAGGRYKHGLHKSQQAEGATDSREQINAQETGCDLLEYSQ